MDKRSDDQFLVVQATINSKGQDSDDKIKKQDSKLENIMYLNLVTRLLEYLLPAYQSIKRHSEFEEYFLPDHYHPSYSWNSYTYISLGH